jgi:hypothetical protein
MREINTSLPVCKTIQNIENKPSLQLFDILSQINIELKCRFNKIKSLYKNKNFSDIKHFLPFVFPQTKKYNFIKIYSDIDINTGMFDTIFYYPNNDFYIRTEHIIKGFQFTIDSNIEPSNILNILFEEYNKYKSHNKNSINVLNKLVNTESNSIDIIEKLETKLNKNT